MEKDPKRNMERIIRHADLSEKSIERYLSERVKSVGGLCLKYANPGESGYPDRLVVLPRGVIRWVELKSRGKKPTRLQSLRHAELERRGHIVHVVDSRERVDELASMWRELYAV